MLPGFFFFLPPSQFLTLHIFTERSWNLDGGIQETHGFLLPEFYHPGSQLEQSCCFTWGSCWRSWRDWVAWLAIRMTLWPKGWTYATPRSQSCYSVCSTGLEARQEPWGKEGTREAVLTDTELYILSTSLSPQSLCGRNPALHAPNSPSTPHPQDWQQVHRPNKVGIPELIPTSFFQPCHCVFSGFTALPTRLFLLFPCNLPTSYNPSSLFQTSSLSGRLRLTTFPYPPSFPQAAGETPGRQWVTDCGSLHWQVNWSRWRVARTRAAGVEEILTLHNRALGLSPSSFQSYLTEIIIHFFCWTLTLWHAACQLLI